MRALRILSRNGTTPGRRVPVSPAQTVQRRRSTKALPLAQETTVLSARQPVGSGVAGISGRMDEAGAVAPPVGLLGAICGDAGPNVVEALELQALPIVTIQEETYA